MEDVKCQLLIGDPVKGDAFVEYKVDYSPGVVGSLALGEVAQFTVDELGRLVDNVDEAGKYGVLKVLGLHLYYILFGDKAVRDAFAATLTEFDRKYKAEEKRLGHKPGVRLRVRLVFTEQAQKYARFPWEFTFVPIPSIANGTFIAGDEHELILARRVPEQDYVNDLEPQEGALRILAVFSQPDGLPKLDEKEVGELVGALSDLRKEGRIKVATLENPTLKQFHDAINVENQGQPHIVHFIGHGEAGKLALIKDPTAEDYDIVKGGQQVHWVGGDELRRLFKGHKPRLAFLSACKGAAASSLESFSSTARELVYSDVPVVVAMQYNITNNDAKAFARKFYEEIAAGKAIDDAVQSARCELAWIDPALKHRRFGTPVVYVQTEKAIILPSKKIDTGQTIPTVKCPNPNCGEDNPATKKFCGNCAYSLVGVPGSKPPAPAGNQPPAAAPAAAPAVPRQG